MLLRRITFALLALNIAVTVYSLVAVFFRLPLLFPTMPVGTLLAFWFAVFYIASQAGWRRAVLMAVIVFLTGLFFESIGVATGLIYGPYHYTDRLGVKFIGLVPYLIPAAWTMMMVPSYVIAAILVPRGWRGVSHVLGVAAIGGIVMTAWDVGMDPMMVYMGHWVWEVNGPYFGVPLLNFFGWWLTTFVALVIYQLAARQARGPSANSVPERWAVLAYIVTGSSVVLVELKVGLGGPALAGIFAMLPWAAMGWIAAGNRKAD